jgi:hypothetical protein
MGNIKICGVIFSVVNEERITNYMQNIRDHLFIIFILVFFSFPLNGWAADPIHSLNQTKINEINETPSPVNPRTETLSNQAYVDTTPKSQNTDLRPWWLGDLITVVGLILGSLIVVYQLGKQHKNELTIQKENYREQLRIEIYQEFSKLIRLADEKNINSKIYVFNMRMFIDTYHDQKNRGIPTPPLNYRVMVFFERHFATLNAAHDLIELIERYYIVDPRLNIFKTAFIVAHHDMLNNFMPLHHFLFDILPIEISRPDGSSELVNVINPSDDQIAELKKLIDAYTDASENLACYTHDLNVELQNTLLNSLFQNKAPRRVPLDPKAKVISTDPMESKMLQQYFEEETDWGKKNKEAKEDVLIQLQKIDQS